MIINGSLTESQQKRSQRYYYKFGILNGFSYMCVGETMMILFAVQMGAPNWAVTAMGAMIYIGFLLLPLGKILTCRYGAATTQGIAWVCRNIAGCFIASAAVVNYLGFHNIAIGMILLGSFIFYGFRAAGVIMSQPLICGMSNPKTQATVCAVANALFYLMTIIALVIIYFLLGWKPDNIWILSCIMVAGAAMGAGCFHFFRMIDEPIVIKQSAARPIIPQIKRLLKDDILRSQVYMAFASNVCIALVVPVSMLALKRGYGIDNHTAMLYSFFQFFGACLSSYFTGKLSNLFGPRKVLIWTYLILLVLCGVWAISPAHSMWLFCAGVLFFGGLARAAYEVAQPHYFMKNTAQNDQVAGSIILSVGGSFMAGVVASIIDAILLKLIVHENTIACFQNLFLATLIVSIPGLWLVWRIKPLDKDNRVLETGHHYPKH